MGEILVEGLESEELDDFTEIFTSTMKKLCLFADKHNFDRDDIVKYFADRMAIFGEIATVKDFEV
jgi:hypothetical protein